MLREIRNSFTGTMTRTRTNVPFAWFLPKLGVIVIVMCILYYFSLELSNPTTREDDHLNNVVVGPGDSMRTIDQNVEIHDSNLVKSNQNFHDVEISDSESDTGTSNSISDSGCQYRGLNAEIVFSGNLRVAQDDPKLLGFVRKCILTPPSPLPYNLDDPTGDPSAVQGVWKYMMDSSHILGNKSNGVYIDCGANDGEDISNTLVLERDFGWFGLLIEADPLMAKKLLGKHRKAWVADICIGTHSYPYETTMYRHQNSPLKSRLAESGGFNVNGSEWSSFTVNCLPLYTLMSALRLKDLDYMSMDIEGVELKVLQTLPFNKINVKVFSIQTMPWLRMFMHSKGYGLVKTIRGEYVEDDVFVRVR